jgi:hypothetical protein
MTFHSSTLIEKIFHRPPRRRQFPDLPGLFQHKKSHWIHARTRTAQRGDGYHRASPWQADPIDPDPTP